MQNAMMTFVQTGPDPLFFGLWRDLDARGNRIKNLGAAVQVSDAVRKDQLDYVAEQILLYPDFGAAAFRSEALFTAARIPAPVQTVRTSGYYSAGDGGGHLKKRIAAPGAPQPWQKQSADGAWWEIAEAVASPLMFGARGDAQNDDTIPIKALLSSPYRNIFWGDAGKVYRVTEMLTEARPFASYHGSATIRLDRSGKRICPLLNVVPTAEGFSCASTLVFDHNAEGIPAPNLANQPAFALGCCVILQAAGFDFSCRVVNSWDCGVGVIRATWTGNGEDVPYNLVQEPGFPQSWAIGHVDGENCGIGQHGGQFGEVGRKGGVVNVLTGSNGTVGSVTGRDNYGGFLVDFGGGAEVNAGLLDFTGTKRDPDHPYNASGIDCYVGSGQVTISSLKSNNAARAGLAVSPEAGNVTIFAEVHAAGEQGVIINGGRIIGDLRVSDCSQNAPGSFDAVEIIAGDADIAVDLRILCNGPTAHRRAYRSAQANGRVIRGKVQLQPGGAVMSPPFTLGGGEALDVLAVGSLSNGVARYAREGINSPPLPGSTDLALRDGMTVTSTTGSYAMNLYFDGGWKFAGNGWGLVIRSDGDGKLTFYTSTVSNTGGAGAAATLKPMASFYSNGTMLFDLPQFADNAAAAAGGVPVSGVYRDAGNALRIRV